MSDEQTTPFRTTKTLLVHIDGMPFELPENSHLWGNRANVALTKYADSIVEMGDAPTDNKEASA